MRLKQIQHNNHRIETLLKQAETIEQDIDEPTQWIDNYINNQSGYFKYTLQPFEPFPLTLYVNKYFSFTLRTELDISDIKCIVKMYSIEDPPQEIMYNNRNKPILKGSIMQTIINGLVHFPRVSVREVSSHFFKGQVRIVIAPMSKDQQIRPFTAVVMVKAKKMK